jgi:virulence factor Mce-like protein
MRRIVISAAVLVAVAGFVVLATGAANGSGSGSGGSPTFKVELDNAFGLTNGEQMKVAGVPAGKITKIDLCYTDRKAHCQNPVHALITVNVSQTGFGSFHQDAFCQSRPQSLIGEYFINCDPGNSGPVLKSGSTIGITHTQSTIPGDLLQAVLRMPYRERMTLIINELGAAVAGNSQNLQEALDRAVPALTETDNLLNLLANDSANIQNLTVTANTLVSALADNSTQVERFIDQAKNAAAATATQQQNLRLTFQNLPPFLEQLRPSLAKLGTAVQANEPALANLNSSAGQIHRLLTDIAPCSKPHQDNQCGFASAALPALQSLGQASITGKQAVIAATPTVDKLNTFAQPTPELAQNLAIVLHDLDDRSRAVEKDSRSPGGQGFTGLEALLQYVFNQTLNLDYLGPFGHVQAVDTFLSPACSPLATPGTIPNGLKLFGPSYRNCYSFLGPNQPGVNSPDPSSPGACPPDPGGQPPYAPPGARPTETGCTASAAAASRPASATTASSNQQAAPSASTASSSSSGRASPATSSSAGSQPSSSPAINLHNTIGQLLGSSSGTGTSPAQAPSSSSTTPSSSSSSSGTSTSSNQAQQLLNYLLSP